MNTFECVKSFYESYSGEKKIIGKSFLGRPIFAMYVGTPYDVPQGIVQGGIHAREFITARLILEQIKFGLCKGGVWFIPLANPDGALLVEGGICTVEGRYRRKNLVTINGGENFSLWKANANAVDLNVNFDACWGKGKKNVTRPAPENYIGTKPFSEAETRVLRDFTLCVCPQFTISYHTKGEEIYWKFNQPPLNCLRDYRLAQVLSAQTGYPLKDCPGSVGGYKDWCICALGIPAFTIEVGEEQWKHPVGEEKLPEILEKNLTSVRCFTEAY